MDFWSWGAEKNIRQHQALPALKSLLRWICGHNWTTNQETEQAVKMKREKTTRDELLKARVSKSFKALVEETAVARGQTPSEAMRQALQEWVHRPSQAA
ncbi:ribbon-helix-helix protein, CopG family [Xanthomonas arboricola]|uniref:ribbon-helix-helix protein, CopG family n=1 Tax=Xanthomonas arboricola TaxID=56448 RepID=UPI00058556AE|nr:ribbon-helix-helix protein, CopG family [Xanthomonas arboricola]